MDHSVNQSMKNAASCVKRCKLQDTLSTRHSNAHGAFGSLPKAYLSEH